MDKPQIIGHIEKSLNYTLFDTKWIPGTAKFVVLGSFPRGTGSIQIYEMVQGDVKLLTEIEKPKSFKCGHFGASMGASRHLATGDFQGRLQVWDVNQMGSGCVPVYSVAAHKEIINAVDAVGGLGVGEGAPEIATASRDGTVKVWDMRQKDEPVVTMEPKEGDTARDCWTVAFGNAYNDYERCLASGYDNGDVKLFDLRTMSVRWETNIKNGVCNLEFDRKDILMNKLVATSLESKIHVWDVRTQHSTKGFASLVEKGHDSTVWLAKHLPQNRDVFMTCGGNGTLHLWKYSYPANRKAADAQGEEMGVMGSLQLLQNTMLSTQPVAGFDWSPDKAGLAVCSAFDQCLRVVIVTKLNKLA